MYATPARARSHSGVLIGRSAAGRTALNTSTYAELDVPPTHEGAVVGGHGRTLTSRANQPVRPSELFLNVGV